MTWVFRVFPLCLALIGATAGPGAGQNIVRLQCDVILEITPEGVRAFGIVRSNIPVTADYEMEVTQIGVTNIGTTTQGGVLNLEAGEIMQTSTAQFGSAEAGFFEAELFVKERLTGRECTAKRNL